MGRGYSVTSLIKSSALLPDIRLLISAWDEDRSVEENFEAAIRQNLFGKASRKRTADILRVFRLRYLPDDGSDLAFRVFVGSSLPSEVTDRVVYYYTALAEPALYDFVVEHLYPLYLLGEQHVTVRQPLQFLEDAIRQGRTVGKWESEITRRRVARGLLSTLRDFGLLAGPVKSPDKTLAPTRLATSAFAYIAFHLKRGEPSGERLVRHRNWQLFFMGPQEVERYFAEAAAEKLLTYQAAGSIVRIEFPTYDFVEYAHALVRGSF